MSFSIMDHAIRCSGQRLGATTLHSHMHQVNDAHNCSAKVRRMSASSHASLFCSDLNCCYDTSWIVSQGAYSHSLAEWALTACSWFAKDLPRLKRQQKDKNWEPYYVEELRLVAYPAAASRVDQCCQYGYLICAFVWPALISDLHFCVAVSWCLKRALDHKGHAMYVHCKFM